MRFTVLLAAASVAAVAAEPPPSTPPSAGGSVSLAAHTDTRPSDTAARGLRGAGKLATGKGAANAQYQFPLTTRSGQDPGAFWWTSFFFDHEPATSPFEDDTTVEDYECGRRSYDLPSYNHDGVDYTPWPFWWFQMDQNLVEVRAAADGVIREKVSDRFDRECTLSTKRGNRVRIEHEDGSFAIYQHLKRNSLTEKGVNDAVVAGEYLGLVGSSGSSTVPHLHFGTELAGGVAIDPYDGTCNPEEASRWLPGQQPAYRSPAIAQLATHSVLITEDILNPPCPQTGHDPRYDDAPAVGTIFYVAVYLRDEAEADAMTIRLRRLVRSTVLETFSATGAPGVGEVGVSFYAFEAQPLQQAGEYELEATWELDAGGTLNATHRFEVIGDRLFRDGFSSP